ncbi:alpha/beta fold hydrolase [Actinomadura kijaniata]|uniref:Lipase n=1 Tax=Actinomadura namibiensis TaxID=182080 RepID=A0A7W3LXQ0_ACTNM|nr:lipase family protein [Actinomadura namibiensis]MBA8956254.1 hypothetical protein [Actinomadura namibiensis]
MKPSTPAALLGAGLLLPFAPSPASAPPAAAPPAAASPARGAVVSSERVARMNADQVRAYLARAHPAFASPLPRHAVDVHRVVHRTVDHRGRPTTASGVVALPAGRGGVRPVSYGHGTHAARHIAGSVAEDGQGRVAAVYFAGAGYAGVASDYLGLGRGPGFHPYGHAASEASASLDMLRAARAVAAARGRTLDRRVLVTGFSQGGHAAMALGRELQRGTDPYLRLSALAPISGPFDLRRVQIPEALREDTRLNGRASAFYTAYLTVTWKRMYRLYRSPSEVFRAPYDRTVEGLFDGRGDFEEIAPHLPARPADLLTPGYLARLREPGGVLLTAMRATDGTCSWRPRVPVRLIGASGDEQVPFGNTGSCARDLRKRGAEPAVVDYGRATDHFGTAFRGLPDALRWFRSLR